MVQGYIDPNTGQIIGANRQPVNAPQGNAIQPMTAATTSGTGTTAGTGTGTGTPASNAASTAPGNSGFAAPTGWAAEQGYTPEMLESIYQNPWFLLQDVFKGINTSSPGYQALRDFGADPLSLYTIMKGSNRFTADSEGGAASTFANFLNDLYTQLGTSGGQELSAKGMMQNIFGQTEFGENAKSDLGRLLGSGDASTQIRTLFNLLRDVAGSAMNPLAASGYQAALAQAGDSYGNAMLKADAGSTQNPVEWMNQNRPWLTGQSPT